MMFRPGFAVAPGGGEKTRAGVAPLSGEVSRMIGIARVVCIFTVIYAHTYVGMAESLTDGAAGVVAISAIKMFLSDGLARVGVPLLGLFSGMLALDTLRRASYGRVLRRKVRSLIVPMMAWSMIFLAVTVGIGLLSGDLAFLRKEVPSGLEAWVNAMLSLTAYPYNGPLHYLRDIFVCFLLLPVILAALQKVPRTTVILAIMVFVWGDALAGALGDVAVPLFLRPGVPALFTVGLALRQGVIRLPRHMWSHVLLPSGVALALLVLIPAALDPSGGQRDALQPLVRMVGVVFVWAGCEALAKGRLGSILWRLEPYVFFVFCSHKITLFLASSALGKVFQWQFPPTIASAYFLAAPVLCFAVAVTGQKVGEAVAPDVVRCLAGGRARGVQLAGEAVAGHVRREAAFDDRTRLS